MSANPLTWFQPKVIEADVVAIAIRVKNDIKVAIADLEKINKWVVAEAPALSAGAQELVYIASSVGLMSNPGIAIAAASVTAASTALNAYAAASNSGANPALLAVTAYTATKQATADIAAAKAALLAPAPTPAPAKAA